MRGLLACLVQDLPQPPPDADGWRDEEDLVDWLMETGAEVPPPDEAARSEIGAPARPSLQRRRARRHLAPVTRAMMSDPRAMVFPGDHGCDSRRRRQRVRRAESVERAGRIRFRLCPRPPAAPPGTDPDDTDPDYRVDRHM